MDILKQVEKPIALVPSKADLDREQEQKLNARIVNCPYYSCKTPGDIYCHDRKQFVKVNDCKVCRVGRKGE